jgi:hypothetical protein
LRLEEAQKLSHVGFWVWDAASDMVQLSEELYRIRGIRPQDFDGQLSGDEVSCVRTTLRGFRRNQSARGDQGYPGTLSVTHASPDVFSVSGEHEFDIRDFDIPTPSVLMLHIYPRVRVHLQLEVVALVQPD